MNLLLNPVVDPPVSVDLLPDLDRPALPRVLIDQVQEPHRTSILGVGHSGSHRRRCVGDARPQPYA